MKPQLLFRICDECGAVLIRTVSGVVCPAGHGKILPDLAMYGSGDCPEAARIGNSRRYLVAGMDGEYKTAVVRPSRTSWYARRTPRQVPERAEAGFVIAKYRGRLLWFRSA
jgi:hypothetical protein